jgi:hypothetical protein
MVSQSSILRRFPRQGRALLATQQELSNIDGLRSMWLTKGIDIRFHEHGGKDGGFVGTP